MAILKRIKLALNESFTDIEDIKKQSKLAFEQLDYDTQVAAKIEMDRLLKNPVYQQRNEREQAFAIFKVIGNHAIDSSNSDALDTLTQNGLAFNSLLARAVRDKNFDAMETLLENGANPDFRMKGKRDTFWKTTFHEFKPLEYISYHSNGKNDEESKKIVCLLLDHGASTSGGMTDMGGAPRSPVMTGSEITKQYCPVDLEIYNLAKELSQKQNERYFQIGDEVSGVKPKDTYSYLERAEEITANIELQRKTINEEAINRAFSPTKP